MTMPAAIAARLRKPGNGFSELFARPVRELAARQPRRVAAA